MSALDITSLQVGDTFYLDGYFCRVKRITNRPFNRGKKYLLARCSETRYYTEDELRSAITNPAPKKNRKN